MPNHILGVIVITDVGVVSDGTVGAGFKPATTAARTVARTAARTVATTAAKTVAALV